MKEEDGCKKSGRTAKFPWQNDKKREAENLIDHPLTTWDRIAKSQLHTSRLSLKRSGKLTMV